MRQFTKSTSDLAFVDERDWLRRVYGYFWGRITRVFETIARVHRWGYPDTNAKIYKLRAANSGNRQLWKRNPRPTNFWLRMQALHLQMGR